jgi:hypothetical protein
MSSLYYKKEVTHESDQSRENLDRLSQGTLKKNTVRSYRSAIDRFCQEFSDAEIDLLTPDDVLSFLNSFTNGNKPCAKRVRYSHLPAFFNFFLNNVDPGIGNPCNTLMILKLYRKRVVSRWEIIEKETVGEIIFRTTKTGIGRCSK